MKYIIIILSFWGWSSIVAQNTVSINQTNSLELETILTHKNSLIAAVMERTNSVDRVVIYRSVNEGLNWQSIDTIQNGNQGRGDAYDPVMTIDSIGNIYLVMMRRNNGGSSILNMDLALYRSSDDGATWQFISFPHVNDEIADYPQIVATSNGELHMVYSYFSFTPIVEGVVNYIKSVDGGVSWSVPHSFSIPSKNPVGPDITSLTNDKLMISFGDNNQKKIYASISDDLGGTWSPLDTIDNSEHNALCKPLRLSRGQYKSILSHRPHQLNTDLNYHFQNSDTSRWHSTYIGVGAYAEFLQDSIGGIHVIYNQKNGNNFFLNYCFSTDSGLTFSTPSILYSAPFQLNEPGEYQSLIQANDSLLFTVFCDWSANSKVTVLSFRPYLSTSVYLNEKELINPSTLKIYPNPAKEYITLDLSVFPDAKELLIFNVKGEVLIQKEVNALSHVKVPISRLTNGIYLIQLISSDKIIVDRFLKQ
jgi:BNR repeat protein/type IX secretion system substrate protein